MQRNGQNREWQWGSLWLILVLIPLVNRPLLPIDETRYVSVAWEMWIRGDWLVPFLNGEAYHHKPPLFFWLIHLGWAVFGVNEWWPRLIPGLFSVGSLLLTRQLARLLWPQYYSISQYAPLILISCLWWSLFTSAAMFDIMLTFFTLLGMVALVTAWQTQAITSWGLLGLAIGLGLLTKGPVMLLHLLPVAILAPWWQRYSPFTWRFWYWGILGSVILGGLIALAWAIPASLTGGEAFRQAIFWGQTANRLVNSFAHNHPLWWYLPWLPILFFPWLLWLPWWRAGLRLSQHLQDEGVRFGLAWLIPLLVVFSLISGKQPHYLLPLFPAFALQSAYLLVKLPQEQQYHRWDMLLLGLVIALLGVALLVVAYESTFNRLSQWSRGNIPIAGIVLLLLGSGLIVGYHFYFQQRLLFLSIVGVLLSLILPLTLIRSAGLAYDLHEMGNRINQLHNTQQVIAHFGDYHGQYQFLGRLKRPLTVVDEDTICPWLIQHPEGKLIVYLSSSYQKLSHYTHYVQPYRSKSVGILDASLLTSACLKIMPLP